VLSFLLLGAGIGFVAGVSPGPVLTLVVAETLRGGWLRGAAVAAGPFLADGPIIGLAFLTLRQLPAALVQTVSLLGGAFLLYLAVATFVTSRKARLPASERLPASGGLLKGLLARLLSPNPYLFWFLVGAPLLLEAADQYPLAGPAFLVGYYSTIVGSNVVLALSLHRWIGLVSDRAYRDLLLVGSCLLGAYGVGLLAHSLAAER
jgi:threonine/homoserine/homoserine lactone efflux protein